MMLDRTTTQAYALCQITGHAWRASFGKGEQWCIRCGVRGSCPSCHRTPLPHAVLVYCKPCRQAQEVREQQRTAHVAQQQQGAQHHES